MWEKKIYPETYRVRDEINKIILDSKSNIEVIEKSGKYFDFLYQEIILK